MSISFSLSRKNRTKDNKNENNCVMGDNEKSESSGVFGKSGMTLRSPPPPTTSMQFSPSPTPMIPAMDQLLQSHRNLIAIPTAQESPKPESIQTENAFLKNMVTELKATIDLLKRKVSELECKNLASNNVEKEQPTETPSVNSIKNASTGSLVEYATDEEELERETGDSRETDWILQKNKKKRKAKQSPVLENQDMGTPSRVSKYRKAGSSGLPTKTNNMKTTEGEKSCTLATTEKQADDGSKPKPTPPINVLNIKTFQEVQELLKPLLIKECKITSFNNDVWRISNLSPEHYRKLTEQLNEKNFHWYTYENANERPIKVMARGIHPTCPTEEIKQELLEKGFQIENVVNIIKKERKVTDNTVTKRGLPLFMLTFKKQQKIEDVYKITAILHMRVKIEPVRKTNNKIAQCKKCQGYNHTQKYCGREPRCVKCAGKHETSSCTLQRENPPKCVNCQGDHPASYRGCEVARELQKLRDARFKNNMAKAPIKTKTVPVKISVAGAQSQNKSFAQILQQPKENQKDSPKNTIDIQGITETLRAINKRLDEQDKVNALLIESLQKLTNRIK